MDVSKVNVSTGVAQFTAPVQSLMYLFATASTVSLNLSVMLRSGVNVVIPFGGSDCAPFNVGAVVSFPVVNL